MSLNFGKFRRIGSIEAYNVFWTMLETMGFDNYLRVRQTDIARSLGMKPQHVSRAVKYLVAKGVIFVDPATGCYRVSPDIAWRGRSEDHHAALNEYRQLQR